MLWVTLDGQTWVATDKADTYEIIRFHHRVQGEMFACLKNRLIWFASAKTLQDAQHEIDREQWNQEWFSNNPENVELVVKAQERRAAERVKMKRRKPKRPKLWKGK